MAPTVPPRDVGVDPVGDFTLHVRCSQEDLERVRRLGDLYDFSISAMVRTALRAGLARAERDPEGFFRAGRKRPSPKSTTNADKEVERVQRGDGQTPRAPLRPQLPARSDNVTSRSTMGEWPPAKAR